MNRTFTNAIRYFMDEFLPPVIRDNRYFMYPLYCLAYRSRNVRSIMDFKTLIYSFSEKDYTEFYSNLNSISRRRTTDLNNKSIELILQEIEPATKTLLDVGCGTGYLLRKIKERHPNVWLTGCDVFMSGVDPGYQMVQAFAQSLPFGDNTFDVVTCCHTLEHILDIGTAIEELKRVAFRKLIIVVPCQRYYYYTLDEHVNFYRYKEPLLFMMGPAVKSCRKIQGDWVVVLDFK